MYIFVNAYIVGMAVIRNAFMVKFMVSRHPIYLFVIFGNKTKKWVG
jgi:hypothetical protein